jgi:hypothetical protein
MPSLSNSKFRIQHSKFPMPFTLQNRETDYATVWAKLDEPQSNHT